MAWLSLLNNIVGIIRDWLNNVRRKQDRDAGAAEQRERTRQENEKLIDEAEKAHDDALSRLDDDGGMLDESDPNLRD